MESKPIHYLKEIIDTEFDIDLKEKTRRREYTEARAIFCKILKKYNRVGPSKLAVSLDFDAVFFFVGAGFDVAFFTSSADATEVSIPIPKLPRTLPHAEVSQFSMKLVLLM